MAVGCPLRNVTEHPAGAVPSAIVLVGSDAFPRLGSSFNAEKQASAVAIAVRQPDTADDPHEKISARTESLNPPVPLS
jgi:hypothetical protein